MTAPSFTPESASVIYCSIMDWTLNSTPSQFVGPIGPSKLSNTIRLGLEQIWVRLSSSQRQLMLLFRKKDSKFYSSLPQYIKISCHSYWTARAIPQLQISRSLSYWKALLYNPIYILTKISLSWWFLSVMINNPCFHLSLLLYLFIYFHKIWHFAQGAICLFILLRHS